MPYLIPYKMMKLDITDRERKLPKWAQQEISDLRYRLALVAKMWVSAEVKGKK